MKNPRFPLNPLLIEDSCNFVLNLMKKRLGNLKTLNPLLIEDSCNFTLKESSMDISMIASQSSFNRGFL